MATVSPTPCRVAILDDDADTAASVAAAFSRSGLQADAFGTAEALLRACDDRAFDAFVLDWLLADRTTLDVIRTLRARAASAHAPIFLLSGSLAVNGQPSDMTLAQAIRRHGLQYRTKPYPPRRLIQELLAALCPQG